MKISNNQETLLIFLLFAVLISGVFYVLVQTEKIKHDNTVCGFLFDEHEKVVELSQIYINYGLKNATEFWCDYYCIEPKSVEDVIEHAVEDAIKHAEEEVLSSMKNTEINAKSEPAPQIIKFVYNVFADEVIKALQSLQP